MSSKAIKSIAGFSESNTAVAATLAAILLLAILFSAFTVVHVEYIPEWKEDAEYSHMNEVLGDMAHLKSNIDSLAVLMETTIAETGSNGSRTGSGISVSVPLSMGGGELPVVGPIKSCGMLCINRNWGRVRISNGSKIIDTDCGSITYRSQNNYYVDQVFCYENGALILEQDDVAIMKLNPSLLNFEKLNDGRMDVHLNTVNISGENESVSGNIAGGMKLTAESASHLEQINITETGFWFTVYTDYPAAWEDYLRATARKAELEEDEDYVVNSEDSSVSFTFENNSMLRDLYVRNTIIGSEIQSGSQNTEVEFREDTEPAVEEPVANFEANVSSGMKPLTVQFTDLSENSPTSREWDLNGDGITDSTEQNPVYTYESTGSYNVSLSVENEAGSDTKTAVSFITVTEAEIPVAGFETDQSSGPAPLTVSFTDTSTGNPGEWKWDFDGDGITDSIEQSPTHTYTEAGTYTVNLSVSNENGTDSIEGIINVLASSPVLEWNFFSSYSTSYTWNSIDDIDKLKDYDSDAELSPKDPAYDKFLGMDNGNNGNNGNPVYTENNSVILLYNKFKPLEISFGNLDFSESAYGPGEVTIRMIYRWHTTGNECDTTLGLRYENGTLLKNLPSLNPHDYSQNKWYLYEATVSLDTEREELGEELYLNLTINTNSAADKWIEIDYLAVGFGE